MSVTPVEIVRFDTKEVTPALLHTGCVAGLARDRRSGMGANPEGCHQASHSEREASS